MTSGFIEALLDSDRPVIMEVKRRSAQGEDLFAHGRLEAVVRDYEAAGAPCLSVVTGRWFGGTPDLLRAVVERTNRPVLHKDFVTRRDQLQRTKRMGAAAVLLTATVLPAKSLSSLVVSSLRLGLTPFVEITRESEIELIPHVDECVVAVNNKDIRGRERESGNIGRSFALLRHIEAAGSPCPVSASGIDRPRSAASLLDAGFAGLLVGTALLRTDQPHDWLAEMDRARALTRSGSR